MKRRQLARMLAVATQAHANQFDRAGLPYILHPIKVMQLLKTDDEELQCIALGHDLIEDTGMTPLDLEDLGFSKRVVEGIWALTRSPNQLQSLYQLQVMANPDAVRVKLCDLQHNMDLTRLTKMTDRDVERTAEYARFYRDLLEIVRES